MFNWLFKRDRVGIRIENLATVCRSQDRSINMICEQLSEHGIRFQELGSQYIELDKKVAALNIRLNAYESSGQLLGPDKLPNVNNRAKSPSELIDSMKIKEYVTVDLKLPSPELEEVTKEALQAVEESMKEDMVKQLNQGERDAQVQPH